MRLAGIENIAFPGRNLHTNIPSVRKYDSQKESRQENNSADPPVCGIGCGCIQVSLVFLPHRKNVSNVPTTLFMKTQSDIPRFSYNDRIQICSLV